MKNFTKYFIFMMAVASNVELYKDEYYQLILTKIFEITI